MRRFSMHLAIRQGEVVKHEGGGGRAPFQLIEDSHGVTAIEYALIAALIAMAFVALITQIGDFVSIPFETVASQL